MSLHDEARRVLEAVKLPAIAYLDSNGVKYSSEFYGSCIDALAAAGLLVTPEMRELVAATLVRGTPQFDWARLDDAVRAYRATLKPKERWTVRDGNKVLFDGELWGLFYGTTHSDGNKKASEFVGVLRSPAPTLSPTLLPTPPARTRSRQRRSGDMEMTEEPLYDKAAAAFDKAAGHRATEASILTTLNVGCELLRLRAQLAALEKVNEALNRQTNMASDDAARLAARLAALEPVVEAAFNLLIECEQAEVREDLGDVDGSKMAALRRALPRCPDCDGFGTVDKQPHEDEAIEPENQCARCEGWGVLAAVDALRETEK